MRAAQRPVPAATKAQRRVDMLRLIAAAGYASQSDFARKVSMAPARVSTILTGRRIPTMAEAERMAETLGVPLPELLQVLGVEAAPEVAPP